MKNLVRTLMFAALLAVPLTSRAQCDTVATMIGDSLSTSSSNAAPINNMYSYSAVEMILDDYEVGDPMTIHTLAFHYAGANAMTHANGVRIYLMPTDKTVFSSVDDFQLVDNTASLVYTGSLNCSAGWNYLPLSTPYDYEGGNLMIIILDTSYRYDGSAAKFTYSDCQGYKTHSRFSDSQVPNLASTTYAGTKIRYSYRPVIKLLGCEADGITCHRVRDLAVTYVGADTVGLAWNDNSNSGATYSVYRIDSTDTVRILSGLSASYCSIPDLDANTAYSFAVRSHCSGGDSSSAAIVHVRTLCSVITSLPQTWSFESEELQGTMSYSLLPWCWSRYSTSSTNYGYYPYCPSANAAYPRSGSHYLYFFPGGGSTYPDTQAVVLPAVDVSTIPLNTTQLSFWGRMHMASGSVLVYVGTMSDPADMSTFTLVDTVRVSGNVYNQYTLSLLSAPAANPYVALIVRRGTNGYLIIDDLSLESLAGCPDVVDFVADSVSSTSVSLSWTGSAGATFTLYDMADNHVIDSLIAVSHYTVTDLEPTTTYTFGVRPNCPGEDGNITTLVTHTVCGVAALPFAEDFEAGGTFPCWSTAATVSGTGLSTETASSGTSSFRFYYKENPPQYLISPQLSGSVTGAKVDFDFAAANSSFPESFAVGYSTTSNAPADFTWAPEQTNITSTAFAHYTETFLVPGIQYIAIKHTSNDQYYLFIDNLTIKDAPTCMPVENLTVDSVSVNSVFLSWTDTLNAGATYAVYNGSEELVSGVGTTSYEVSGLDGSAAYDLSVVAQCSATDESERVTVHAVTECDNGLCPLTFFCYDAYYDGWNGAYISVYQLGAVVSDIACLANNETYTVPVCGGNPVSLVWHGSAYNDEPSFVVLDGSGDTAYTCAQGFATSLPTATPFLTLASPCPGCLVPIVTVDSVTTSSVSISWTGSADSYNVYLNDTILEASYVTDNYYTFTGLDALTGYSFGVVAMCSDEDSSLMGTASAITACDGNSCSLTVATGSYGLLGASIDVVQNGTVVGVVEDMSGTAVTSSVSVCGEQPVTLVYHQTPLQGYGSLISFTVTDGSGALVHSYPADPSLHDSVLVVLASPCPECQVPVPTVVDLGRTSATISWDSVAASYDLYLDDLLVQAGVADSFYTFIGLSPATAYTFGVVAHCSAAESSAPGTVAAVTPCEAVTTLPYSESFDLGLGCWASLSGSADGLPWFFNPSSSADITAHSGSGMALSVSFNAPNPIHADAWLVSPEFVLPATDDTLVLSWWFRIDGSYPDDRYEVLLSTLGSDTASFTTQLFDLLPTAAHGDWTRHQVDLSAYAGRSVHIAFHHYDSYDADFLALDDVELYVRAYVEPVPDSVAVTYAVSDVNMGSTAPAGTHMVAVGDSVVATATARQGYELAGWTFATLSDGTTLSLDTLDAVNPLFAGTVSQAMADSHVALRLTALFRAVAPSGIGEVDATAAIAVADGRIVVRGATGSAVSVYDLSGRCVASTASAAAEGTVLDVPAAGAYMVKVGDAPARRVVVVR